jgi:TolB-like protein/tetratricopeptide (TPR) repeat protein
MEVTFAGSACKMLCVQTKSAPPTQPIAFNGLEDAIRRQLSQILKSKTFRQVDRLQRFLAYIVEETLAGRGEVLKEYPVGVDVFGKQAGFDPRMDPIVRVQARRLRIRLATYYRDEGPADDVLIELPKGGYTPNFRRVERAVAKKAPASALLSRNTVMVLQFADNSADGDCDYFCSGLRHEIINALSEVDSIIMVSRDSAADPNDADDRQPAAIVVSGSIRKSGSVLRITMHMSDAVRGCFIWSHSIDRNVGDIFAIQEEVAQLVLRNVRDKLLAGIDRRGSKRQVENLAAHNMYLQGRYHLNQRTEHGLTRAVHFFTKAMEEDPQMAEAYACLADAENLLAHYGVVAPADVWTKAASNAAQAVMLDGESAEARTSFAHVKSTQDWDWEGSELEFRRAISLDPKYSTAHHWYAVSCLVPQGRLEEALEELLTAQALDPISSIVSRDIAVNHYYRRDFESALQQCDHTIEQNPHFSAAYWTLGLVQEQRGEMDEAVAAFRRAIELSLPRLRILGSLGRTLALAGKKDEAIQILSELEENASRRYISPFELALIHFALEQTEEGFECLTKALQDRCFELVTIKVDPRFDSIAADSRFIELTRQIGLS